MGMKICVTGAAGFIGTWLTEELENHGHNVVRVDKHYGRGHNLLKVDALAKFILGCDYCVHLAARVGRLFGEENVADTIHDNTVMTAHVARSCARNGVKLAYASTSEVYGDQGEILCGELNHYLPSLLPHNAYGLSKRHGEEFCRLYAPEGLQVYRFSMPFGPGHPPGYGRAAMTNFLWNALKGEEITVHRDSERAWCWIGDTVRAVRMLLEGEHAGPWNIGRADNKTSMLDVAKMACDLVGANQDLITEIDPPARQTVVKRLDMSRVMNIGWKPEVELDEGMQRTLDWLKADFYNESEEVA